MGDSIRGIRLSEKYGLNPTRVVCFWCNEDDGTVIMLGRLKGDAEAPRRICVGYEPCKSCGEKWADGVVLAEAATSPLSEGQRPMDSNQGPRYPTGRWIVADRDWILEKLKKVDRTLDVDYEKEFRVLLDEEAFEWILNASSTAVN